MPHQKLALISIVVDDYDKAIAFYTDTLGFELVEDTLLSPSKRWVVVRPVGSPEGSGLLLAQAANPEQASRIGNQTGGRVFLFLHTDQFDTYFQDLVNKGVTIIRPPSVEPYGKVAVFEDLYGNLWDLIEPTASNSLA